MKKLFLLLLIINSSYSQEKVNIYIILEDDDSSYINTTDNNKEHIETYHFYKKEATLFNNEKGGFSFIHKKVKKVKFKNTKRKFWDAESKESKSFSYDDKIIIDKNWFNKYDEDLIFSFFTLNNNYNYYVVSYKKDSALYWIKEVFFWLFIPSNELLAGKNSISAYR